MRLERDALEVIALIDTNISDLVQSITLYESIDGYLQGTIQIIDGTNFYDEIFGTYDRMIPLEISYKYADEIIRTYFAVDGISDMKIKKSQKEYTMHLITSAESALKLININEVYYGTSDEIISSLWKQCLGGGSTLVINTQAVTKGKYIVPNIPAINAVDNVVNAAVDKDHTGFYLFQRMNETGTTHLSSLMSMSKDFFKDNNGDIFEISNKIASTKDSKEKDVFNIGTSNKFTIEQYKINHTDKLAAGFWGNNINHVRLDQTKVEKHESIEKTFSEITQYKISDKLYDVLTESRGPHGEPVRYQQKSLFSTIYDSTDVLSVNLKRRMNENQLKIDDITPIPFIGVGKNIRVAIGSSNKSISQADGNYIIADINHSFIRNSGRFDYNQSMTLIREMA